LVEETWCEGGNNDAVIRSFRERRRDLTAQPDRIRIEVLCHRHGKGSTVRILWNESPPPKPARRKARWSEKTE
jgi:hypothetical protein